MHRYPDAKRSRVVLIGTSDFERPDKLQNLPGVRGNLSGLERTLTDPERGVFDESSVVVIDSPDSVRSFVSRLNRAAEQAEDVLLVYYAGHGTLDAAGSLYLAVRETDPTTSHVAATAVPFTLVRQILEDSVARVKMLILDCCFSGRAVGAMAADTAAFEQIDASGTYVLTSTEANRIALAPAAERYTAFSGELVKLLAGTDDDGELTLDELQRKLRSALARADLPRPLSRADDTAGMLVVRRAKPRPKRPEVVSRPVQQLGKRPLVKLAPGPPVDFPRRADMPRQSTVVPEQAMGSLAKPAVKPTESSPVQTPAADGATGPLPPSQSSNSPEMQRRVTRSVHDRVLEIVYWVLAGFTFLIVVGCVGSLIWPAPSAESPQAAPGALISMAVIFAGLTGLFAWLALRARLRRNAAKEKEAA